NTTPAIDRTTTHVIDAFRMRRDRRVPGIGIRSAVENDRHPGHAVDLRDADPDAGEPPTEDVPPVFRTVHEGPLERRKRRVRHDAALAPPRPLPRAKEMRNVPAVEEDAAGRHRAAVPGRD